MTSSTDEEKAVELAQQALKLVASGQAEAGSRALRQAVSLAPENPQVEAAFHRIQADDAIHPLLKYCEKYNQDGNEKSGREILQFVERSNAQLPLDVLDRCMDLVVGKHNIHGDRLQDSILTGLLQQSPAAKRFIARRLQQSVTVIFNTIYTIGDRSASCLAAVTLDPAAWSTESSREVCQRDVFQLFIAKLMESGHDHDGRALKGISRLLAANAEKLQGLVDQEGFEALLVSLDNRLPTEVQGQAILATAKYLEVSGEKGQNGLSAFITTRLKRHSSEDLILAFSAAAAVFPIVPSAASALFLTEGFLQSLVPMLEKKAKHTKIEQAALDMLSAACIDSACRDAVGKYCSDWLEQVIKNGKDQRPAMAAVILAKVRGARDNKEQKVQDGEARVEDLVPKFKDLMAGTEEKGKQSSIEGLAYASMQPKVKEQLAKDRPFLKRLIQTLEESTTSSMTTFGGLSLINNLTRYRPTLSEEQKRMAQLKAYANASKETQQPDPLDDDTHVTSRCKSLIDAGIVSLLVNISKKLSPTSLALLTQIFLSLSKTPSHRGTMAQQGSIRTLILTHTSITSATPTDISTQHTSAHALARILISVNPNLIFSTSVSAPLTSAIRPLKCIHQDHRPLNILIRHQAPLETREATVP
ncbi:UNC-45/Ring assembly protein 3 [Lasallia pustulata]|uniref:UNC-45/Ring assembly protein 3 n=1 Tax=Lasallia pustulata TaxID=136370 RepID=A0A1W5D044_9LECA|nr:UNC-45/Ring assembly protein 3 [Lasallia pustulata]